MTSPLFSATTLGPLALPHRVAMAPMTRSRAGVDGVPTELMATYYGQRATAAVIVTEATQISPQGQGYSFTPGIHDDAQVQGWRRVTDAVHARGGRIVVQLWHVGRMSHPSFHPDGLPVAPSALPADARVWVAEDGVHGRMVDTPTPRALTTEEVADVVEQYRRAAANAVRAGFDGVEIHGANGYLVDQFLRTTSNLRTDRYGGSVENRARFVLEVVDAVAAEIGADRVGLRLSPQIKARGMGCPEIETTILHVAREVSARGIAYLHLVEADWDDAPEVPETFRRELRAAFPGTLLAAGGYDVAKAERMLDAGLVDVVAFGRPFIANPDLPARLATGAPLAPFDGDALFGGGAAGYTTYAPASDVA